MSTAALRRQAKANALGALLGAVDALPGRLDPMAREELGILLARLRADRARLLGAPPADPTPTTPPVVASDRAYKFADWFKATLPGTMKPTPNWRDRWAECYDALVTKDGRTPEQISTVCQWARRDKFWATRFLSPLKLRDRNDAGVLWFDAFLARATPHNAARAAVETGQHYPEPAIKLKRG